MMNWGNFTLMMKEHTALSTHQAKQVKEQFFDWSMPGTKCTGGKSGNFKPTNLCPQLYSTSTMSNDIITNKHPLLFLGHGLSQAGKGIISIFFYNAQPGETPTQCLIVDIMTIPVTIIIMVMTQFPTTITATMVAAIIIKRTLATAMTTIDTTTAPPLQPPTDHVVAK